MLHIPLDTKTGHYLQNCPIRSRRNRWNQTVIRASFIQLMQQLTLTTHAPHTNKQPFVTCSTVKRHKSTVKISVLKLLFFFRSIHQSHWRSSSGRLCVSNIRLKINAEVALNFNTCLSLRARFTEVNRFGKVRDLERNCRSGSRQLEKCCRKYVWWLR